MPRISLLRVLLLPPACWLALVLLWVVLPAPPVPWNDEASEYLWQGGTVTRVYKFADFFPWSDPLPAVQDARGTGRTAFAVDYTYCWRTGELTISGGTGAWASTSTSILGSGAEAGAETGEETEARTPARSGSEPQSHAHAYTHTPYANTYNISALLHSPSLPYTAAPFILRAKAGDQDGMNLPSFPEADATLLFWEVHGDVAELPLRVRVVNESTVQIWPDSKFWDADRAKGVRNRAETPSAFPPLLSITFNTTRTKTGDKAKSVTTVDTFVPFHVQFPRSASTAESEVESEVEVYSKLEPTSSSPSRTFVVRRTISALVVPVGLFVIDHVFAHIWFPVEIGFRIAHVLFFLLAVYVAVVFVCWKAQGSPPYWRFTRTFWLTRPVTAYLGPRLASRDNENDDDELFDGTSRGEKRGYKSNLDDDTFSLQRPRSRTSSGPKPLTSFRAFFSSRSPLDDLFVTFDSTRGFVRPLEIPARFWFWRPRERQREEERADGDRKVDGDEDGDEESRVGGVYVPAEPHYHHHQQQLQRQRQHQHQGQGSEFQAGPDFDLDTPGFDSPEQGENANANGKS
ncbi:hypothetical protein A1O3_05027 [Capronia epimyces CBS 606.96]|uniref:Uncharacterized protein n=1 Tax=Capronia epimyces CBS 606.96 TaxID=1182542 RepID=W9Y413_9EURO|nr:uncharacterized protein A1O3_05027 [Capronia epimyces CBS 606.96]EXJ84360.1 hypothetical protein A1O3_05027 [Capronia epimyces CBS 606.96]